MIASYQSLFSGIGKVYQDTGNQIDRSDYVSGNTILAFDLIPDHCPRDHFELMKQGNLRLELHFSEALTNTVNLIICAEYQNVIEIDQTETFSATTQTKNGHQSAHAHFEKGYIYKRCVSRHVSLRQAACKCFTLPSPVDPNVDKSEKLGSYWVALFYQVARGRIFRFLRITSQQIFANIYYLFKQF